MILEAMPQESITPVSFEGIEPAKNLGRFIDEVILPSRKGNDNSAKDVGMIVSPYYTLTANGTDVPCYAVRTRYGAHSFAMIDVKEDVFPIELSAGVLVDFRGAAILPESYGVEAQVSDHTITAKVESCGNYTFILNKDKEQSLTVFICDASWLPAEQRRHLRRRQPRRARAGLLRAHGGRLLRDQVPLRQLHDPHRGHHIRQLQRMAGQGARDRDHLRDEARYDGHPFHQLFGGLCVGDWMEDLGALVVYADGQAQITDVEFRNIEIYRADKYPINITVGDDATAQIDGLTFSNIRILFSNNKIRVCNRSKAGGTIDNVQFKDIYRKGTAATDSKSLGLSLSKVDESSIRVSRTAP